jgi:hypothetical protein
MNLTDILNSVNYTKVDLSNEHDFEKSYVPFVVNRCLGYHNDSVFYANYVNKMSGMGANGRAQYLILKDCLTKKKRFAKWVKPETVINIDMVMEYYGYSHTKALRALSVLTDDDINIIKQKMRKGGLKNE